MTGYKMSKEEIRVSALDFAKSALNSGFDVRVGVPVGRSYSAEELVQSATIIEAYIEGNTTKKEKE